MISPALRPLARFRDKRIVLISHDLCRAGSELLLLETAVKLRDAGAHVRLVTLADDARPGNLAARNNIALLPLAESFRHCASADLVIANTAVASGWVNSYLQEHAMGARSLIWWIHEIDACSYAARMNALGRVAMTLFDSHASLRSWAGAGVTLPPLTRVLYLGVEDAFVKRSAKSRFPHPGDGILQRFGLDPRLYTRAEVRKKLGIAPDDFAIALIGTFSPKKGHGLLVRTVSRLLDRYPQLPLKVILVGFWNQEQKAEVLNRLNEAGRRALDARRAVSVVHDLTPYYAASDAFVMNSQGLGENFGRVTIEAMAFKLPVLGTDAGGTPEIVEDGVTGLLHPVGIEGQEKLAENILTLMNNRDRARTMGDAGSRRVDEKFSAKRFDAEFSSLIQIVLDARISGCCRYGPG
jgi:glycosyltransferase involved in cell wall biosynthesis